MTTFKFSGGVVLRDGVKVDEVHVRTLQPGDGLYLPLDTTGTLRPAVLVNLSAGSATVMLMERVKRTIRTQDGVEREISALTGLQHWCLDTLVVPSGERHDITDYQKLTQIKGATIMAKEKKSKKSKANGAEAKAAKPKVYAVVKYEPAAKAASEKGIELQAKATHNGTLLSALIKAKEPLTFAELCAAVPGKAFGSASKNVENIYRWHVSDLVKKGFIKSVEEKVEAPSAELARAGATA